MGAYLSEPVTEKHSASGAGDGHVWGVSEMQGWRQGMEDSHVTISDLGAELGAECAGLSLFGVFDGHGGKEVALFCERHVPLEVQRQIVELRGRGNGSLSSSSSPGHGKEDKASDTAVLAAAMVGSFHAMDDKLRQSDNQCELLALKQGVTDNSASSAGASGDTATSGKARAASVLHNSIQSELEQAKENGKLTREEVTRVMMKMSLLKRLEAQEPDTPTDPSGAADNVGCTAVCALMSKTHIVCANAGDSRAVLCRRGKPVELSHDHKPNDAKERSRIHKAGGTIEENPVGVGQYFRITYRINGNLNLSRSIGDLQYKKRADLGPEEQMICSTPDIICERRTPDDEFMVIACDGVWDVKSNEDVVKFVSRGIKKGQALPQVIEELLDDCIAEDPKKTCGLGGDNMTCLVVQFRQPSSGGAGGEGVSGGQDTTTEEQGGGGTGDAAGGGDADGGSELQAAGGGDGAQPRRGADGERKGGCMPFRWLRR